MRRQDACEPSTCCRFACGLARPVACAHPSSGPTRQEKVDALQALCTADLKTDGSARDRGGRLLGRRTCSGDRSGGARNRRDARRRDRIAGGPRRRRGRTAGAHEPLDRSRGRRLHHGHRALVGAVLRHRARGPQLRPPAGPRSRNDHHRRQRRRAPAPAPATASRSPRPTPSPARSASRRTSRSSSERPVPAPPASSPSRTPSTVTR